jgi:hypothetical protein
MTDLLPCPGGCGQQVHPRADECPQCGYRPEIVIYHDLLTSVITVSSIFMGFGLAGLVSLSVQNLDVFDTIVIQIAADCWIFSSLLFLVVLVKAELVRRVGTNEGLMRMTDDEQKQTIRRCNDLLGWFAIALLLLAVGLVIYGFRFGWLHGVVAVLAAAVGFVLIRRVLR